MIHRYFFGQWPEMPWKKATEGERKMQPIVHPQTVTVLDGQSLSEAAIMGNLELCGVVTDSGWNTAALTFQGSYDNVTYFNIWNGAAELAYAAVAASTWVMFDPAIFLGIPYIKVRSGTGASAVNQTGDSVVTLILRPVI
jgi:hypothetical protein